ncbi:MAG: SRPBCC domain-containing protein [Ferruginibacter sp.]
MKKDTVIVEKTYNAPVAKVWKAITNKRQMKDWYFDLSAFNAELGFEFRFSGKGKDGETFLHLCKITELVLEKKLVYSWRYEGYEGVSFVSFELFPEGEHTRLLLTHEGLESFPAVASFARDSFLEGWTYLVQTSLKEFVEKNNDFSQ